jgi:hypothetical protein
VEQQHGSGEQRAATEASAAAAAKEALMCALNLQALEQLVALGEEGVCSWDEIEDDLCFHALSWAHVQGVVHKTRTPLVILSLLDREGTLVAWVVPAEASSGVKGVKMVLMEKRQELRVLVHSWAEVPALLSTLCSPRVGSNTTSPPPSPSSEPPASAACEQRDDAQGSGVGKGGEVERKVLRVLYDVCWKDVSPFVQSWEHVRLVLHGELLLVPWGDLQDSTGRRLADQHIFSVEPCLNGLIQLLENLAPDSAAAGGAVPGMPMEQMFRGLRAGASEGTGLVVAAPRSVHDEQCSWMQASAQERQEQRNEADEDRYKF